MRYKQLNYSAENRLKKIHQKSRKLLKFSSKSQIFKTAKFVLSLNFFLILNLFGLIAFETFLKGDYGKNLKFVHPLNFLYGPSHFSFNEIKFDSRKLITFSIPYESNGIERSLRTGINLNFQDPFDFPIKDGKANVLIDHYILNWYGPKSVFNKVLIAASFCLPLTTSLFLGILSSQVLIRIGGFIFTKLLPTAELEKISKVFFLAKKRPSLISSSSNTMKLDDFLGSDYLKEQLDPVLKNFKAKNSKFLGPLKFFQKFSTEGQTNNLKIEIGSKILLIGPSGSGKTFLAEALAGEANRNFIKISPFDLFENKNWLDQEGQDSNDPIDSDQQIRLLKMYFNYANSYSPSALFFDNFEFFGKKRSDVELLGKENNLFKQFQSNQLISLDLFTQFLVEIDGLSKKNQDTLLLAATSDIKQLDPALIRSGRFDKHIYIKKPNLKTKKVLIGTELKKIGCKSSFNWATLISRTGDFENASLVWLVKRSFIYCILYSDKKFSLTDKELTKSLSSLASKHPEFGFMELKMKKEKKNLSNKLLKRLKRLSRKSISGNKAKTLSRYELIKDLSVELIDFGVDDIYEGVEKKELKRSSGLEEIRKKVLNFSPVLENWDKYSEFQKSILSQSLILTAYKKVYDCWVLEKDFRENTIEV